MKKNIVAIGGCLAAGSVLALILAGAFSKNAPASKAREKAGPSSGVVKEEPPISPEPSPPPSGMEVAHAMGRSMVRQKIRLLMKAAATGDDSLRASMMGAVVRTPEVSREVIREEMAGTKNLRALEALEDALARCRQKRD